MSCCNCNSTPCNCVPRCPEDCPEVIEKTATNINLAGVGVYDGEVSDEFQFRGIRSENAFITVSFNAALDTIDIAFQTATFQQTATFANAATRANTVPAFEGQLGVQLDTDVLYIANGTLAGNWIAEWLLLNGKTRIMNAASELMLESGLDLTFSAQSGPGSANVNFTDVQVFFTNFVDFSGTLNVQAGTSIVLQGNLTYTTATSRIRLNGVDIPADSVFITSSTAGQPSSKLISQFLSTSNVQVYGAPTGTLSRATFDESTVTLPQLAQRVAALITDLQATLKPST